MYQYTTFALVALTIFAVFNKISAPEPISLFRAFAEIIICALIGALVVAMFMMGVGDL
jgi:hypothetical protein